MWNCISIYFVSLCIIPTVTNNDNRFTFSLRFISSNVSDKLNNMIYRSQMSLTYLIEHTNLPNSLSACLHIHTDSCMAVRSYIAKLHLKCHRHHAISIIPASVMRLMILCITADASLDKEESIRTPQRFWVSFCSPTKINARKINPQRSAILHIIYFHQSIFEICSQCFEMHFLEGCALYIDSEMSKLCC